MERWSLTRRAALRGLGTGTALLTGVLRSVRAEAAPADRRALFLFYANGSHYGWAPEGSGEQFKLTPHLAPLEKVRQDIIVLKRLNLARGRGNPHKAATYSALGAGGKTSVDQLLAASWKGTTPLTSLELAIGFTSGGGGVAPSLSQIDGVFVPGERNPFAAYQRVASRIAPAPGTVAGVDQLLTARRSVLDYLNQDVRLFRARLSPGERTKADLFLESVRDLEKSLTHLIERLKSFAEGPGTVLDNTLVVVGTQNGNSNQTNFAKEDHDRRNTPFILAGGCGGAFKTGRLLDCGEANHNDLYVSIMRAFGLDVTTVGDPEWCSGPLAALA